MDTYLSSCAADEGCCISDLMTLPDASQRDDAAAAASVASPPASQTSSSEGYATSQGSLTSSSSETISPASDADNVGGAVAGANSLAIDSLTLALEELRNDTDGAAARQRLSNVSTAGASDSPQAMPPLPPPPLQLQQKAQLPHHQHRHQHHQPKPQRSSSMKSHKTPPGTPNQMKKVVRFADAFGLDLAYVKHVFDTENPPVIPPQATMDLNLAAADSDKGYGQRHQQQHHLADSSSQRRLFVSPCFAQPGSCANFVTRVMTQKVVLERASVAPSGGEIQGVVRVANIGFEKSVLVRLTFDAWRSSQDVQADYVPNSGNGATDQFSFAAPLPAHFSVGDRAVFCVRYCARGETYWDNNFGDNYAFDCFAVNSTCDPTGPGWTHFL